MANIATVLKEEISRLSRKEIRSNTEHLKKSSAKHRSEIAALKRQVSVLERQVAHLVKVIAKQEPEVEDAAPKRKSQFSSERFKALRHKLGISAQDAGTLLGVSPQTVYNWETGKTRPRDTQLEQVVALTRMGKRQVSKLLDEQ